VGNCEAVIQMIVEESGKSSTIMAFPQGMVKEVLLVEKGEK